MSKSLVLAIEGRQLTAHLYSHEFFSLILDIVEIGGKSRFLRKRETVLPYL